MYYRFLCFRETKNVCPFLCKVQKMWLLISIRISFLCGSFFELDTQKQLPRVKVSSRHQFLYPLFSSFDKNDKNLFDQQLIFCICHISQFARIKFSIFKECKSEFMRGVSYIEKGFLIFSTDR